VRGEHGYEGVALSMAARLVECASCGTMVEASEAAADAEQQPAVLLEQAPELVKFYCPDCWDEGAAG
jgi:predicted RNA-binding Zn-ribbon protein involved in translation (DUF1610 family)